MLMIVACAVMIAASMSGIIENPMMIANEPRALAAKANSSADAGAAADPRYHSVWIA